ncbi:ankyrin repeat and MYND domain-containing protein 1-like isoform X3 [Corythoichthys intestinalis]|nr:ankyrin repeat and MYND domain-containing protein 1-like isoform X3 [Corythoichthys intestinalis]
MYCWPTGNKFIGKFYLNWREGYGKHIFPDGATFKGLYHADQRFGPGVLSEPTGCQDVGLWHGKHLMQMCNPLQGSFCLKNTEYAALMEQTAVLHSKNQDALPCKRLQTKTKTESETAKDDILPPYHDNTVLPYGTENYSTNGDHLPLPPSIRREFDHQFYGLLQEHDSHQHEGYKWDPRSTLPLTTKMLAHIHQHSLQSETLDWDVAKVLSSKRDHFGPKGPLEVISEQLIQQASRGGRKAVLNILLDGLVHPDVTDSQGNTALIAATRNCHDDIIQLLLDMGADIDKLNCEGMSALSVCHVLYYPFQSLYLPPGTPAQTQDLISLCRKRPQNNPEDTSTDSSSQNDRSQTSDTIETNWDFLSNQIQEELSEGLIFHRSSCSELSSFLNDQETPAEYQQLPVKYRHSVETGQESNRDETFLMANSREGQWISNKNNNGFSNQKIKLSILTKYSEEKKNEELLLERSIPVKDGHIILGHVKWKEYSPESIKQEGKKTTSPLHSTYSYNIQVSEELLQGAAEALSHPGLPHYSDTRETVRKMAAMKFKHRVRLHTLNLLLDRGADPNISRVPFPVLFLAIMAADTETVRRLILCGAQTDISLSPERKGFYPLHVAAALPGPEGPKITELLLQALSDPDARACDQEEIYEPDIVFLMTRKSRHTSEKSRPEEGGRTALHMACQREKDHRNASKVVSLLLSHSAKTDLLWSGHSPLSLAIASGNEKAVEELLKGGADPNIPLGCGVGNALCAVSNFCYDLDGKREKLLDMLVKAGADMLKPVQVGDSIGNVVDYAHHSFDQDVRIAHTPFHILSMEEREIFKARHHLLSMMGSLLRETAIQRENEQLEKQKDLLLNCENALSPTDADSRHELKSSIAVKQRSPSFRFCYNCGRSAAVKLTACSRCQNVFFCSTTCKLKAWDERHKEECLHKPDSVGSSAGTHTFPTQRDPKMSTNAMPTFKITRSLNVQLKSQIVETADVLNKQLVNLNENYSYN